MKKIRLELGTLAVESFRTAEGGGARGTVRGHAFTDPDAQAGNGLFGVDGDSDLCPTPNAASCDLGCVSGTCPSQAPAVAG